MNISFTNFLITPLRIECLCTITITTTATNILEETIFFDFSSPTTVSPNYIAIALSTLCIDGKYETVYFDLDLSDQIVSDMKVYCKCNIFSRSLISYTPRSINSEQILLNFSGGFDSLAARQLMPSNTNLISLNFGNVFSRETEYFKNYNPYTVTTNVRSLKLTDASWSFMGIASILYSETLHARYISFGTIFEASLYHLLKPESSVPLATFPPFKTAQLINLPFVLSLTEVATALVLIYYCPNSIQDSLTSLAAPGSTKFYRKQLLTRNACEKLGVSIPLDPLVLPRSPSSPFGKCYCDDFLCPYLLKHFGSEVIAPLTSNIPQEIYDCVQNFTLTFYERYNPDFIANLPSVYKNYLTARLELAHILPFSTNDYEELSAIKRILQQFYHL